MPNRTAILVAYPDKFLINEAVGLADAAGYGVVRVFTQPYLKKAKYGVGTGKAEEIRRAAQELTPDAIIFDERLKSVQVYNLAKLTGVEAIDRERLILEIFAKRATTAEAGLQVQLAELRYEMPRAREKVRLAKMGEQPGFFGLGKYEVEVYYRSFKRRLTTVSQKLQQASKRRQLHRDQRHRLNMPMVSLSGYTGVGKTTLFNLLTGESKEVDRGAFTTLTTSTRAIPLLDSKALLSDTVGFISRLPTYMIEAFRSTLEELTYANLVLLLVDIGDPLNELIRKYNSSVSILAELKVSPARVLLVLNKADLANPAETEQKAKTLGAPLDTSAVISAKTGLGIEQLKRRVYDLVFEHVESTFTLSRAEAIRRAEELDWLKQNASVELVAHDDGAVTASIRGPSWIVSRFQEHRSVSEDADE